MPLKMFEFDQVSILKVHHQHHLGTCWKCKYLVYPRPTELDTLEVGCMKSILVNSPGDSDKN